MCGTPAVQLLSPREMGRDEEDPGRTPPGPVVPGASLRTTNSMVASVSPGAYPVKYLRKCGSMVIKIYPWFIHNRGHRCSSTITPFVDNLLSTHGGKPRAIPKVVGKPTSHDNTSLMDKPKAKDAEKPRVYGDP